MKNAITLLFIVALCSSCSDDNKPTEKKELVNKWKLTEVSFDIGDGNSHFLPIESNLVIEFYRDETVSTNEKLCNNSDDLESPDSGTYSFEESVIYFADCTLHFEMEGSTLIMDSPGCIEPCYMKFITIE